MAHEIDQTTGRAAVFAVGRVPWHGLGATIDKAVNSRDAIALAGMDWTVEQWPVYATPGSSNQHAVKAERHLANVRTDTNAVLGVVSQSYTVFQNREAFDFMDAIVGDKLAMYETAGSLKGGRKVWMLARIPREYRAGSEDVIHPYVLLVNSHDGSTSLKMIPTTVRVVCSNTLNLAMRQAGSASGGSGAAGGSGANFRGGVSIRHLPSLDARVKEARAKLGIVAARFDQFDDELHRMLDTSLRAREVQDYFQKLLPPAGEETTERQKQARRETLRHFHANFENDTNSLAGVRGTAWAAYNAVSEWADHQRTFRGRNEGARSENRLNSVWFGASHQLKQHAYRRALELVNN